MSRVAKPDQNQAASDAEIVAVVKSWWAFVAESPAMGDALAAALSRHPPEVTEGIVERFRRMLGPWDPRDHQSPPPEGLSTETSWQRWAARMLTCALVTTGEDAFNDLVARLRPHTPDSDDDTTAWDDAVPGTVESWAVRWNLGDELTGTWNTRWCWLPQFTSVDLVVQLVFYEARYRLTREHYGEAWTARDETLKRLADFLNFGQFGPLADYWNAEIQRAVEAQLPPPPSLEDWTIGTDEKRYVEAAQRLAEARVRERKAAYEAVGIAAAPTKRQPRHFDWYIRFQVLEHSYTQIASDVGVTPRAVWEATRDLAEMTQMPLRLVRSGRPQGA